MLSQSKSILAKLLATENISVEHKKIHTAYFDTKNRVMALPIWKEMSSELYDLLLGHETGHALYTPNDGWHDSLKDNTKKGYKTYLNVIEDVRIEKQIQEKYPGLKTSFRKGYSELMERDFFGVESSGYDLNTLPLIDRINLHYKIGSYLNLYFSDEEKVLLSRIDKIKTWSEVVKIVDELYARGKDELRKELENLYNVQDDDYGNVDGIDFEEGEGEYDYSDGDADSQIRNKNLDPMSKTDAHFRRKEKELIDDTIKPYYYADCPTPILENIVVPYKKMKELYNKALIPMYSDEDFNREKQLSDIQEEKTRLYKKFNDTNKKYIGYLVKEFELRRNARQYARASVSKTGELDLKKIHNYKLSNDLFKRVSVVPQGKSHGLLMFLDYSGSMNDNICATIEQTLILATFCRKVNIPFRVYAFTDLSGSSYFEEFNLKPPPANAIDYTKYSREVLEKRKRFSQNVGELNLDKNANFRLREYLSSEMSSIDFKEACKYWLLIGNAHKARLWRYKNKSDFFLNYRLADKVEGLNGTPLNEAIVASMGLVKEFRKQYKLDVVNTVFLTDGDANETFYKIEDVTSTNKIIDRNLPNHRYNHYNFIVRDRKTMLEGKAKPGVAMTVALLNLLRETTGANAIGFFIVGHNPRRTILDFSSRCSANVDNFEERYKKFRKENFFMLNDIGYNDFYFIPNEEDGLGIKEDFFETEILKSKNEIKKAFMTMQRNKGVNRILLNRFITKIA